MKPVDGKVEIVWFERSNGRCPGKVFFDGCIRAFQNKFKGSFGALLDQGLKYENQQRFHALHGDGRPLWEFKEADHRLFCAREVREGGELRIVLFGGWVKATKKGKGKTRQEDQEISKAVGLYNEYREEVTK
jgi:hypothetical protein